MPKPKPGTGKKPTISPPHRYADGQHRRDAANDNEQARSPTRNKRIFDHAIRFGAHPKVATKLGRLYLAGEITLSECSAGFEYAEVVGEYERWHGHPRSTPKSPSWESGFGRSGIDIDYVRKMDPEAADRIEAKLARRKKKADKAYDKAMKCFPSMVTRPMTPANDNEQGYAVVHVNSHAHRIIDDLCCSDEYVNSIHLPLIKDILGKMARAFNINEGGEAKQKKPETPRIDASVMANAVCDVMEDWFANHGATIHAFEIGPGTKHKHRRLTCFGVKADYITPFEHGIEFKVASKLIEAATNAQFIKAAQKRGWNDAVRRKTA